MSASPDTATMIAVAPYCVRRTPMARAAGPAISAPAGVAIIEPSAS
jgi:hypothetical protein